MAARRDQHAGKPENGAESATAGLADLQCQPWRYGSNHMNCKEAHRVLCEAQDSKLSFARRLALRWHLAICDHCTRFGRQLDFLRTAVRRYRDGGDGK